MNKKKCPLLIEQRDDYLVRAAIYSNYDMMRFNKHVNV